MALHTTRRHRSARAVPARAARKVGLYVVLTAFGVLFFLPFCVSVVDSLMMASDILHFPPYLLPPRPTLQNYVVLITNVYPPDRQSPGLSILRPLLNSIVVAVCYVIGSIFFCSLAGHAFAKYRFWGRDGLFSLLLATMLVPSGVGLIPNFIIMTRLRWVDTWLPLIVPGLSSAFGIFLMRQSMVSIPDDLIDAARMDGAGEFGTYWRVVVPVARPALGALTIYMFLGNWNAFLAPLVYLTTRSRYTLPLFLSLLSGVARYTQYAEVLAASVISTIPVLVTFLAMQRQFVTGITLGAVKE